MTYSLFEFAKEHGEELVVTETVAVTEEVRNQHPSQIYQTIDMVEGHGFVIYSLLLLGKKWQGRRRRKSFWANRPRGEWLTEQVSTTSHSPSSLPGPHTSLYAGNGCVSRRGWKQVMYTQDSNSALWSQKVGLIEMKSFREIILPGRF